MPRWHSDFGAAYWQYTEKNKIVATIVGTFFRRSAWRTYYRYTVNIRDSDGTLREIKTVSSLRVAKKLVEDTVNK